MPATMRIWRCPRCEVGVRAPHRPPADHICRLCFPCTNKTRRLIYRVLVVRETAKKQKAAAARAKRRKPAPRKPSAVGPRLDLSTEELSTLFDVDLEE